MHFSSENLLQLRSYRLVRRTTLSGFCIIFGFVFKAAYERELFTFCNSQVAYQSAWGSLSSELRTAGPHACSLVRVRDIPFCVPSGVCEIPNSELRTNVRSRFTIQRIGVWFCIGRL